MTNIEASIKEIHTYAQKYLDLLHERHPQWVNDTNRKAKIEISVGKIKTKYFHGARYPGTLIIADDCIIATRSCGELSLNKLLDKMLKETKEEYETYRDQNILPGIK